MQRLLTGRVNVKLLIIIGTAFVLSIGALAGGHHVRKRSIANRALTAGRSAAQAQNWPEAATQLRLYLSSYPNDAAVLEEYARAQLSIRPLRSDQLVAAVIAYRRLLRFQPGDRRLCDRLVRLYGALRNHNEVGYVARLRLEADPTDAAAMAALGRSLLAQRRADDVQRELSRYVANGKVAPEVCALLADAAMQATPPSPDAALKWLNTAVESNPDSAAALAFRGRFYLTAKKKPEQARADLSSADKLGSADAPTRLLLAEVWLDLKEYDRAEAELDLFEQSPLPPETLDFEWQDLRLRQYRLAARSALLQEDKAACARLADFGLSDFPEPQRGRFLQDRFRFLVTPGLGLELDQFF